jgi:hypothetical protein
MKYGIKYETYLNEEKTVEVEAPTYLEAIKEVFNRSNCARITINPNASFKKS